MVAAADRLGRRCIKTMWAIYDNKENFRAMLDSAASGRVRL